MSSIGDRMVPVALTFAVIELTGSGSDLGLVLAAGLVPNILFVLAGGVLGDRFDRSRVMLGTDLLRAATQATVAILLFTDSASIWSLALCSALWGTGAAFFAPASTGVVPLTVSRERLQQANALMSLTRNAITVGAPALAGILVATVGTGIVFAIDAATFVASALFLLQLRLPKQALREATSFVAELAAGWREVISRSWLWASILGFCGWNVGLAFFFVLGPLVAERELGGARDWGLILTGSAIGSVIGAAVALRFHPRHALGVSWVLLAAGAVQQLLLVPPAPTLVLAFASAAALVCISISGTLWITTMQEHVPERALSRVSAYDWLGSLVAMPIGYVLAGPFAEAAGMDSALITSGALMVASSLFVLAIPSVRALTRPRSEFDDGPATGDAAL
jgi:MFS family permease